MKSFRVICTTVKRGASDIELSGRIIEIELPSGEIVSSQTLPSFDRIRGPRGGSRGARGVCVKGERIYVAIYSGIMVFDLGWHLIKQIVHPLVVGHHEIAVDDEGVWCCSTLVDAVIKLDFSGNIIEQFWASENDDLVSWVGARSVTWDKGVDYRMYDLPNSGETHPMKQFHINTVHIRDGEVFAYDSNHQALFQIFPTFRPIVRNPRWDHAHNVILRGNEIFVNNSAERSFEIWCLPALGHEVHTGEVVLREKIEIVSGPEKSTQFSRSGWIRGLIVLTDREFIVGSNPTSLYHIKEGMIVQSWQYSIDVNEAVHGLTLKQTPPGK